MFVVALYLLAFATMGTVGDAAEHVQVLARLCVGVASDGRRVHEASRP